MPVAKAAKEYGVHYTSIYKWVNKGIKAHSKLKSDKKLSTTKLNTNGTLTTDIITNKGTKRVKNHTVAILPAETRDDFQPRVKEVILHLSGTFVPDKGQLRVTRELLNYLNEVGAHLTK